MAGCARLAPWHTPAGITDWQPTAPPALSLGAKAAAYQARIASLHGMPDGVIRYRVHASQSRDDYGDLPDGPFFAGLYLASQALRLAATGEAAARDEVRADARRHGAADGGHRRAGPARALGRARALAARHALAALGHAAGLLVARGREQGPAGRLRLRARRRAGRAARPGAPRARRGRSPGRWRSTSHEHALRVVDPDGEPTTHGDLRPRLFGFPVGVNALIALAVGEAAEASGRGTRALRARCARTARSAPRGAAHWSAPGNPKRVNQNMAYVSLLPLLRLEHRARAALGDRGAALADGGRRAQRLLRVRARGRERRRRRRARKASPRSREFPDRKRDFPVDLTRPGFDFRERVWKNSKGEPRAKEPLPLYLRPSGSNLWVSDPRLMVGSLPDRGETEYAGIDYLLAYWLARERGFVAGRRS